MSFSDWESFLRLILFMFSVGAAIAFGIAACWYAIEECSRRSKMRDAEDAVRIRQMNREEDAERARLRIPPSVIEHDSEIG